MTECFRRGFGLALWFLATPAFAGTAPSLMQGGVFVLAGGAPGDHDGTFLDAEFRGPVACALEPGGASLLVLERDAHRLRRVGLGGGWPGVETLAGGTEGLADGGLAVARFKHPDLIQAVKGAYVIRDQDGTALRRLDLGTGKVDTLVPPGPAIRAFFAADDGTLYLQPEGTGAITWVTAGDLTKTVTLNMPAAWIQTNGFFVRDGALSILRTSLAGTWVLSAHPLSAGPDVWEDRGQCYAQDPWMLSVRDDIERQGVIWDHKTGDLLFVWNGGQVSPLTFTWGGARHAPLGSSQTAAVAPFPFPKMGAPAWDAQHGLFYYPDPTGQRILGIMNYVAGTTDLEEYNQDGREEYSRGQAKLPGLTRVAFSGTSLSFWVKPDLRRENAFYRKLERYSNLFSSLQGLGRRYELYFEGAHFMNWEGGILTALRRLQDVPKYDIDELWIGTSIMEISNSMAAEIYKGSGKDGLPINWSDPALISQPAMQRIATWPPDTRQYIEAAIKLHPQWKEKNGKLPKDVVEKAFVLECLEDPALAPLAVRPLLRHFGLLIAAWRKLRPQGRVVVFWLPERNFVGVNEMQIGSTFNFRDSAAKDVIGPYIQQGCQAAGVEFFDIQRDTRVAQADYFPLHFYGDHHYNASGADIIALLAGYAVTHAPAAKR